MVAKLNALRPLALLLLRLVVGGVMLSHGLDKWMHLPQTLDFFTKIGMTAAGGYVAATVEFVGGALLLVGLLTRYAAFFVSGEMFVAFLKVHWKIGERAWYGFLGTGDAFTLLLCVAAFLLLTFGAGAISLDRLLFKENP